MDSNKRPQVSLTADIVLFAYDTKAWYILLIKRKNRPYKDCWALPGGFVNDNEEPYDAALRELTEETCIVTSDLIKVEPFTTPNRDPRGRVISFPFTRVLAKRDVDEIMHAKDDATEIKFFPLKDFPELAFDHQEIVKAAQKAILKT